MDAFFFLGCSSLGYGEEGGAGGSVEFIEETGGGI